MESKTAVVTGASGNLGLVITEVLLERGYGVVAQANCNVAILHRLAKEHGERTQGNLIVAQANLADEKAIAALFALVEKKWGYLNCLVNAVGGLLP